MADRRTLRATLSLALRDRKAATAVEYGMILALVVLGLMVGLVGLGGQTRTTWGNISTKVIAVSPQ